MTARIFLAGVALMSAFAGRVGAEDVQKEAKTAQRGLNELSLEVTALQMLHQFQFTASQLEKIRQCVKETAEKGRSRQEGQASQEFRDKLEELRKALVQGGDEDSIEQLGDELDDLRYEEKPSLEDDIKVTNEARRRARSFSACSRPTNMPLTRACLST